MQIPNPFSNYSVVRATCKTPAGDVVCTASVRGPMEVPDDAVEALIEPMCNGRPNSPVATQGRIWSPEWGVLCIEDHLGKQKAAAEAVKIKENADRERRGREAAEKAKKIEEAKKIEKAKKIEETNASKGLLKKTEKKVEKNEKTSK